MTDDDRIEEIRKKKMEELRQQAQGEQERQEEQRKQAEQQREAILRRWLTDDARQRLNAVEMTKPKLANAVKDQVAKLAQSGRIKERISGEKMKEILKEMQPDDDGFDIKRR